MEIMDYEIKERIINGVIISLNRKRSYSLEECVNALNDEQLDRMYHSYDISDFYEKSEYHSKKYTRFEKVSYVINEIPGQFGDYYCNMLDPEERDMVKRFHNGDIIDFKEVDDIIFRLADYGFIYLNKVNDYFLLIIPREIRKVIKEIERVAEGIW